MLQEEENRNPLSIRPILRSLGAVVVLSSVFLLSAELWSKTCTEWFSDSGIDPSADNCEDSCATLDIDMGTFDCPSGCVDFCQAGFKEEVTSTVLKKLESDPNYHVRLTDLEKRLIALHPVEARKVMLAARRASIQTEKEFEVSGPRDESDAYRHFIGTGILAMEIGVDEATGWLDRNRVFKWLNAHEAMETHPEDREMDYFNNQAGWTEAVRLQDQGKLTLENLDRAAKEALSEKRLKVLELAKEVQK